LTDTGTTLSYLLKDDYLKLIKTLCNHAAEEGMECFFRNFNYYALGCEDPSVFHSVWYQIDGHLYEVPSQSYVWHTKQDG
jgi:hypothetical protein